MISHQTRSSRSTNHSRIAPGNSFVAAMMLAIRERLHVKPGLFNPLLLPVLLMLLSGAVNLYLHAKYQALVPIDEARHMKLQKSPELANFEPNSREALISLAREAIEDDQRTAKTLYYVGMLFIYIGVINFLVILKYLKRDLKSQLPPQDHDHPAL
jgi:hypothetical protein